MKEWVMTTWLSNKLPIKNIKKGKNLQKFKVCDKMQA